MKRKLFFFLIGFFIIAGLLFIFLANLLYKSSNYNDTAPLIIEKNLRFMDLSKLFVAKKICENLFISSCSLQFLKIFNYNIKYGEYFLPQGVSVLNAMKIILSGKVVVHKITIPEGFTVFNVINRLDDNEFLLGEVSEFPEEGSLMPDTYCFKYPTTKQQIIKMAQASMTAFLNAEWEKRSKNCVVKTPQEALIFASIIEKETPSEHELIAGVYSNRLKINMRLQADPTTIYAHTRGAKLGTALSFTHLKIQDPYNTYRHKGLPPTPISNPGRVSLLAVLHPVVTDNLFFVYDKTSKHLFAKTFSEHKNNIKKIKKMQKQLPNNNN